MRPLSEESKPKMTSESPQSDPYVVLGIGAEATEANIRKAWRKKTNAAGPGTPEFAAINDAAELLLAPERRAAYDAQIAADREAAEQEAAEAARVEAAIVAASTASTASRIEGLGDEPNADKPDVAVDSADDETGTKAGRGPVLRGRLKGAFVGWNGTATIAGCIAVVAVVLAVWQGVEYTSVSSSKVGGPGTGGVPAANYEQSASNQQSALAAVTSGLPAVLGYNYGTMPADEANAGRFLTAKARPGLAASYQRLISGGAVPGCKSTLAPIATRKTVVTATVVSVGVVSVSSNVAQIGAFVNQTTNVAGQAAVTTENRVLVNLQKVNGSWLIDTMTVPNTDHVLSC